MAGEHVVKPSHELVRRHGTEAEEDNPGVRMGPFEIRPALDMTGMVRDSEQRRAVTEKL